MLWLGCSLCQALASWPGGGKEVVRGASSVSCSGSGSLPQNRYKQKKEIENRLAALKATIDSGQAEEEQTREFYLLQIKKWIGTSLEEIESIDQEMAILNRRDALKKVGLAGFCAAGIGTRSGRTTWDCRWWALSLGGLHM